MDSIASNNVKIGRDFLLEFNNLAFALLDKEIGITQIASIEQQ